MHILSGDGLLQGEEAHCSGCTQSQADIASWRGRNASAPATHPLLLYESLGRSKADDPNGSWNSLAKSIIDPTFTAAYTIHYGYEVHGACYLKQANATCIKFLHLNELFRLRNFTIRPAPREAGWWWPLAPGVPYDSASLGKT